MSRQQALAAGMSVTQIRTRLTNGAWLVLSQGVYAVASSAATWERQLWAAILGHPRSIVGGRSAAFLLEFDGVRRSRPEILAPFPGNARSDLARVIRSRHFDKVTTALVDGYPCTTVAETILTMSLRENTSTIRRILDSQLSAKRLKIADFDPILERLRSSRQPGWPALRIAIGERASDGYQPPTSELERLLYRLLDRPEIPPYERQLPMVLERLEARVDAYVPSWNLIIEADGRRWHTRVEDFERDRTRDNAAVAAGLRVIRLTYAMLKHDPESCLETVLAAGSGQRAS